MIFLKQSTASQEILLGPFLDKTDGSTAETALTIANTDIKLWKRGGTSESNKNSGGATHIAGGRYYAVLDATDTDTIGEMEVNVHITADALPIKVRCCVLHANVFDWLFGSTAPSTYAGGAVASVTGAVGSIGTGGITSGSFAAGAIDAAAIAADAIGSSELAASAVTEIQSGLASQTSVDTLAGYVDTEVAAIKAKTDNLPSDPADASDIAASFSTVNSTLATIAAYIDTEVAAIKAKTDNLPSDPADASDIAASFTSLASTLSTIAGYIDTEVAAIKAKTDNLPAAPAAVGDIPTVAQIWTTALTEAYRATGATGTAAQLLHEILQNITEFTISGTTKTVKKFDGSTTAKTYTLNDATTPTGITETT